MLGKTRGTKVLVSPKFRPDDIRRNHGDRPGKYHSTQKNHKDAVRDFTAEFRESVGDENRAHRTNDGIGKNEKQRVAQPAEQIVV